MNVGAIIVANFLVDRPEITEFLASVNLVETHKNKHTETTVFCCISDTWFEDYPNHFSTDNYRNYPMHDLIVNSTKTGLNKFSVKRRPNQFYCTS